MLAQVLRYRKDVRPSGGGVACTTPQSTHTAIDIARPHEYCTMPRSPSPYGGQRRRRTEVSPPDYMDEFGGRHHQPAHSRGRGPRYDDERTADRGGMRGAFDAVKNFISESTEDRDRPRRAKSHREPRPRPYPPSDSDSGSPPPRRRRDSPPPRAKARAPEAPPAYADDYDDPNRPQRRRRPRENDYYSDSRHDRPRRDAYDERPRRRDDYDEPPRRRDRDDRNDDRPRRRDPYDERYDDRPRRRDTGYDDRPRRDRDPRYDDRLLRDPRDDRVRSGRGGRKDVPDWQRQAKDMFFTHAMPVIKKEGPKLIAKYAGDFLKQVSENQDCLAATTFAASNPPDISIAVPSQSATALCSLTTHSERPISSS
ncbi:uncharacterized protein CC84DRAFT_1179068 [Paraphaeosphaeria sporulosa]|uniref:Uncharacterized protein n=1 Tax=Paraphaeosphaeria sporulosa TaxID=1460663 RepID=A0A177C607_9PLEO|nr:uncharacterized protein CC84DRAFT_1179068 [Paraphaeosphaeria sporulosa]OAG02120.1 hypothetical protein CC84DRAFT_1179068 [Paraphaeosphaeria sporulosa]